MCGECVVWCGARGGGGGAVSAWCGAIPKGGGASAVNACLSERKKTSVCMDIVRRTYRMETNEVWK